MLEGNKKSVCLPAGLRRTYGDVVCVESMAETESVTQHGRGNESSVHIGLSNRFPLGSSRIRSCESATVASASKRRGVLLK